MWKYIKECETCQCTKSRQTPLATSLHPHDILTHPWEIISLNLIGPLPESAGQNTILVIVDCFSKMIKVIPSHTEITLSGVVCILCDHVFHNHGLSHKIISDYGSNFIFTFMKELYSLLGITGNLNTAYHPQIDDQTEQLNQEVEHYLQVFTNYHQNDWAEWASLAKFAYNDKAQSSTHHSPFYLNYGFHSWKGSSPCWEGKVEAAKEFADRMQGIHTEAEAALCKAVADMKKVYNHQHSPSPNYKIGDWVWLEVTHIKSDCPTKKLDNKHGKSAYKLQLPAMWKSIYPIFNECVLTLYSPPQFPLQIQPPPPPPDLVAGVEEQEIEEIVDSHLHRGHLEYLMQWKGFPHEEHKWKMSAKLCHAKEAIVDFHHLHPAALHPLTTKLRLCCLENFTTPASIPQHLFNWENGTFKRIGH